MAAESDNDTHMMLRQAGEYAFDSSDGGGFSNPATTVSAPEHDPSPPPYIRTPQTPPSPLIGRRLWIAHCVLTATGACLQAVMLGCVFLLDWTAVFGVDTLILHADVLSARIEELQEGVQNVTRLLHGII